MKQRISWIKPASGCVLALTVIVGACTRREPAPSEKFQVAEPKPEARAERGDENQRVIASATAAIDPFKKTKERSSHVQAEF